MTTISCTPQGVPAGGQFETQNRPEADATPLAEIRKTFTFYDRWVDDTLEIEFTVEGEQKDDREDLD